MAPVKIVAVLLFLLVAASVAGLEVVRRRTRRREDDPTEPVESRGSCALSDLDHDTCLCLGSLWAEAAALLAPVPGRARAEVARVDG